MDELAVNVSPSIDHYVEAVSAYVLSSPNLSSGAAKQAQIALSAGLGRVLVRDLTDAISKIAPERAKTLHLHPGERDVAGALRSARADVSESHELDGLRVAVEIKPINLAVGRAIWNRFGDVRAFGVNIHLKFPFAVVGGVLVIPTWEWKKQSKREAAAAASKRDEEADPEAPEDLLTTAARPEADAIEEEAQEVEELAEAKRRRVPLVKAPTLHLIDRLTRRLARIGRRNIESDPAHLLEAVAVVVYDPDDGTIDPSRPAPKSGLRWDEFVDGLAESYDLRFE